MRSCPRSNELRSALAAKEPLSPELARHVSTCAACTRTTAAANRFEALLDAAMAALVTDALPPSTAAVARSAPPATRRWAAPRIVASAIVTVALGAFAAVGVVATGNTISDAIRHGSATAGPGASVPAGCTLGDPTVDVMADATGAAAAEVRITYCLNRLPVVAADGEPGVTCIRSGAASSRPDGGYLDACTRVEEVGVAATEAPAEPLVAPTAPLATWDDAAKAAGWPVRRPGWMPGGYDLVALQGFGPSTDPDAIDSLVATYLHSGMSLSIDQFVIAEPSEFRIELTLFGNDLDTVTTGQTTVNGHAAFWATGIRTQSVFGPQADMDTIVLTWSDGRTGYRISARDLELAELRRIAASLHEG